MAAKKDGPRTAKDLAKMFFLGASRGDYSAAEGPAGDPDCPHVHLDSKRDRGIVCVYCLECGKLVSKQTSTDGG